MLLGQQFEFLTSPLGTPLVTIVLCALAGVGTWLLMPVPGKSVALRRAGLGMAVVAFGVFALLLLRWATLGTAATTIYFWVFSAIAIYGALRVITHPLPVYSAMFFVLTVFSSAGLFVLLWAEFLAMALILIYAGAILVVYTFVIMLASEASGKGMVSTLVGGSAPLPEHDASARSPLLATLAGFLVAGTLLMVIFDQAVAIVPAKAAAPSGVPGGIQNLGVFLFSNQLVSVQVAGLILTLAMVGAIMIARKKVLLGEEDQLPAAVDIAPYTPVEDNPHNVSVAGLPGPRSSVKEQSEL